MNNMDYKKIKLNDKTIQSSILIAAILVSSSVGYTIGVRTATGQKTNTISTVAKNPISDLEQNVLPSSGVTLPVVWGNLGTKLVSSGVIDADKFKSIYEQRGQFTDEYNQLLTGENNGKLKITSANSGYILNILWAFGLANKNEILEKGEMVDKGYGGADKFASTGGWTVAKGNVMDHYSKHAMVTLTPEQQALVDKVSRGIFRPCCGNSAHFPDCNHGMAMLGLLELMASQDVSEQDMWSAALAVNSYWFPDTYLTIATYMKSKGTEWKNVNPQEVLGREYSSSRGYANIASQVTKPEQQNTGEGSGCSLGGSAPVVSSQGQQSGCSL